MFTVSDHAVARWVERYAPGASALDAEAELVALARHARPVRATRRGAHICVATTADGRPVHLVLRGASIVTVLPIGGGHAEDPEPSEPELPEEEGDQAATLGPELGPDALAALARERDRRGAHEATVARWRAQDPHTTERAARRAFGGLGLRYEPRAPAPAPAPLTALTGSGALRIEGGRYGGVAIELRETDTAASIVGRLLGAMRASDEARRVRG